MPKPTLNSLVSLIVETVQERVRDFGFNEVVIDEHFRFFDSGILDSLGFIAIVAKVEESLGVQLDFGVIAPDSFADIIGLAESFEKSCNI